MIRRTLSHPAANDFYPESPSSTLILNGWLSNGRGFADARVAEAVAAVGNRSLRFSIPIHGDVPEVHDHIAQAKGALRETVAGLYNLENNGVESEIRIVLHARSIPRLTQTAEFIRRKLPFVRQIALMGMENTGYATMNWSDLWIDPIDYRDILTSAVRTLHRHGMDVSIYNIPLCVLAEDVRGFARRSISDHKQVLVAECDGCQVAEHCAGFFASCVERHSRAIKPTRLK